MPKRKYISSPETQQDEAAARKAGFIRAAEAREVLGVHRSQLEFHARKIVITTRTVGREIWYSGSDIDGHLSAREKGIRTSRRLLKMFQRKH